jgi:apoptosis-inducing factor 3
MSEGSSVPQGPDLAAGVAIGQLAQDATLLGRVGDQAVLLARAGEELFAVSATCTHYGGPLAEGLRAGDTIRCPWHHACFSLRSGAPLRAPALNALDCWRVERSGDTVYVREKRSPAGIVRAAADGAPRSVVIVGGGAAGHCAAETLRGEGYDGRITLISADSAAPCDRPNLSKDYLAGNAPEEWIPLRPAEFYSEQRIELRLGTRATAIGTAARAVELEGGETVPYDRLLIATGAEPVRLDVAGSGLPHVHYLRSLADSRSIIQAAEHGTRAVIIGASFIALEVAASLRTRNLEVQVVAPEALPMARIFGSELGRLIQGLHEEHGVRFHLGTTARSIEPAAVTLSNGARIGADLVVIGVGVRPLSGLAEAAGIRVDRGIAVNPYLETSVPGVFAAGDVARWPDPHSGESIRIEHWVVAERQGQTAARNMLGRRERFESAPFFWSVHYGVQINYVGHAASWDQIEIEGRVEAKDCKVSYRRAGRTLAVATIGRDLESLRSEVELERSQGGA